MNTFTSRGWTIKGDRIWSDDQGPFLIGLDFTAFKNVDLKVNHNTFCIGYRRDGKSVWMSSKNGSWLIYVDFSKVDDSTLDLHLLKERTEKTLTFVEKAWSKHGKGKWGYEKTKYVKPHEKVKIRCFDHGIFEQSPANHLSYKGCKKCSFANMGKNKARSLAYFIEKAEDKHGKRYDYSEVVYVKNNVSVIIICSEHGPFHQTPGSHLRGSGCISCSKISPKRKTISKEEFIRRSIQLHGNIYDYSQIKFQRMHIKVYIGCPKHDNWFWQTPEKHCVGRTGCKICRSEKISLKLTDSLENFIKKANLVHGDLFDYSKVRIGDANEKVEIICRIHGSFFQQRNNHIQGNGCPKCIGRNLTNKEFLTKAREKHDDKFKYPEPFVSLETKIVIICKIHGKFHQSPKHHLISAHACPKCRYIASGSKKRRTQNQFLEKASLIHGNRYDYSESVYVTDRAKIKIKCQEHGIFEQNPNTHLSGSGCPKCVGRYKTHDEFVALAREIHGELYDYPNEYVKSHTKLEIWCKRHEFFFSQTPHSHLQGHGCRTCKNGILPGERFKTHTQFLEEAKKIHGETYQYPDEYVRSDQKLRMICSIHGEFLQTPNSHLGGSGCNLCGFERSAKAGTKSHETFVIQAMSVHDGKYSYPETYIKDNIKITIECPKHGPFKQVPSGHLQGRGCSRCLESKGEREVNKLLKKFDLTFETQKRFAECKHIQTLPFDFYIKDLNLLIEYDGIQHFKPVERFGGKKALKLTQYRDSIKTKFAEENGYELLRIRYDEDIEEKLLPYLE